MRRCRSAVVAALLAAAPVHAAPPRPLAPDDCGWSGAQPAALAAVDENFDLLLGDGRVATLSGLAFSRRAGDPRAVETLLDGRDLHVRLLSPEPDRWGRIRIRLYAREADGALADVGEELARRGLAVFRPDPDASGCRRRLLAAEAAARTAAAGFWARDGALLDAGDRNAVAAASAGFLVVEGVVANVGEARGRIYLNLGRVRTIDLAIVILGRNISAFESQGVALRDLTGRRIRARGLLDRRFGPQIEIVGPDAIEVVETSGAEGVAKGR